MGPMNNLPVIEKTERHLATHYRKEHVSPLAGNASQISRRTIFLNRP